MDVSFIDSTAFSAAKQLCGIDRSEKLLTRRYDFLPNVLSLVETTTDRVIGSGALQISALIYDAVAPPPVKPRSNRTAATRLMTRKKRRLRRRSAGGGGEDGGLFGGDDDDGGGDYFGGDGGGAGGGWNFGGYGGHSWDESSNSSASDPASDFVYEVICWIALSNCVHFAFKKVARGIGEMIGQHGREKVQLRLGSLC